MTQAFHWDRGRSGVPSGAAPLGCHIARHERKAPAERRQLSALLGRA
jgi:hypothetical protein